MQNAPAPHAFYDIGQAIRTHGLSRELLVDLAENGRFALLHDIQKELATPFDLTEVMIDYAFSGPRRALVLPQLMLALNRPEPPRAAVLRKICALTELQGNLVAWRQALASGFAKLDEASGTEGAGPSAGEPLQTMHLARLLHDVPRFEALAWRHPKPEASAELLVLAGRYRSAFAAFGLDANQPRAMLEAVAKGRTIRLPRPTVVLRLSSTFWDDLPAPGAAPPAQGLDSLVFLPLVRSLGLDAVVIPQTFNAGPAFAAPFDLDDPNLVCVIAHHKYNYNPHPKLLNYRKYFGDRYLLDYGGYSGWTLAPPIDTLLRERDAAAASEFCAEARQRTMTTLGWPKEVTSRDPYVFVALQLQSDSVEQLAFVDPAEMLDMCIRHFTPMGWQVVTKLHPRDCNPEMLALAGRVAVHPRVTVSTAPSMRLVRHASAVAVVNSTVGWEAVLAQKPILTFGRADYSDVSFPVRTECDLASVRLVLSPEEVQAQDVLYHYFATCRTLPGVAAMLDQARAQLTALLSGQEPPLISLGGRRPRFGARAGA